MGAANAASYAAHFMNCQHGWVNMNVLITGGSGYLGSNITADLLARGHKVSWLVHPSAAISVTVRQLECMTNRRPTIYRADIRMSEHVMQVFHTAKPDVVIHLAGIKRPDGTTRGDRVCFDVNVSGTYSVLRAMERSHTKAMICASSLSVMEPIETMSTWSQTLVIVEKMLNQACRINPVLRVMCLRYGMISGTHPSGFLAEREQTGDYSPLASLAQVACGEKGKAWIIPCNRDHIHISDVASVHHLALAYLRKHYGILTLDIGSGIATGTEDLLHAFESENHVRIPYGVVERSIETTETLVADTSRAWEHLGWRSSIDIARLCRDSWHSFTTGSGSPTDPPISRIAHAIDKHQL
jgi:UDP-glucose 4-epimerase